MLYECLTNLQASSGKEGLKKGFYPFTRGVHLCLAGLANSQDGLTGTFPPLVREGCLTLLKLFKDRGYWEYERQGNRLIVAQLLRTELYDEFFYPRQQRY